MVQINICMRGYSNGLVTKEVVGAIGAATYQQQTKIGKFNHL